MKKKTRQWYKEGTVMSDSAIENKRKSDGMVDRWKDDWEEKKRGGNNE